MRYEIFLLFSSLFLFFPSLLFAQSSSGSQFAHPLQVEPTALYSKIRGNFQYWDKRNSDQFERNRNINLEGEYKFNPNFSVISSIGRNEYQLTGSERELRWDRWNAGIKFSKEFQCFGGDCFFGTGIRLFNSMSERYNSLRENPVFYQVRPNLGFGYKSGIFEIQAELRYQTETTRSAREENLEQFRRYYQLGLAPSIQLTESIRTFLEFEYREPVQKEIDTKTRFFQFYPGITYNKKGFGTIGISALFPVIPVENNAFDRGMKVSYFVFF